MNKPKYFISEEIEVDEKTFIQYEQKAGFISKIEGRPATGGFSTDKIKGRIDYEG